MFEISKRVRLFSFVIHFPSPLSPFTEAHDGSSPPLRGGDGGIKPSFFSLSMCFENLCWNQGGEGGKPHAAEQSGIKEALRTQPVVLWCLAFPEHPVAVSCVHCPWVERTCSPPPSLPILQGGCMQTIRESPLGGNNWARFFQALLAAQGLGCVWVSCASSRSVGTGGTGMTRRTALWWCTDSVARRAYFYSYSVCSRYGVSACCPVCWPIAPLSTSVPSAPFQLKWRSLVRSL